MGTCPSLIAALIIYATLIHPSHNYACSPPTIIMSDDPTILACCLQDSQQPYIGVDQNCHKSAIFCLEHSSHVNSEGLIHQMLPLKDFKRSVFAKKFLMQEKVETLVGSFSRFMDQLIQEIRDLKLRKSVELSMLWLRELATDEREYELMKQVYRMDFRNLSCQDIHSVYFKIIHNQELYSKQAKDMKCYQGISEVLADIADNKKAINVISKKISEIEGVLTSGKILRKVLPDHRVLKSDVKEVLLEEALDSSNYQINYYKAALNVSSLKYLSIFSKYSAVPHTTYHIAINTKYSNIMVGVCSEKVKTEGSGLDQHYEMESIVYNCSNGNTYRKGMFFSGSNAAIKGLHELVLKLRVTDTQVIVMTQHEVLMRAEIGHIKGPLFIHGLARTKGDSFEFQRDKQISSDNLGLLKTIQKHLNGQMSPVSSMESLHQSRSSQVEEDHCSQQPQDEHPKKTRVTSVVLDFSKRPAKRETYVLNPVPEEINNSKSIMSVGQRSPGNRIRRESGELVEPIMIDDSPLKSSNDSFAALKERCLQKYSNLNKPSLQPLPSRDDRPEIESDHSDVDSMEELRQTFKSSQKNRPNEQLNLFNPGPALGFSSASFSASNPGSYTGSNVEKEMFIGAESKSKQLPREHSQFGIQVSQEMQEDEVEDLQDLPLKDLKIKPAISEHFGPGISHYKK